MPESWFEKGAGRPCEVAVVPLCLTPKHSIRLLHRYAIARSIMVRSGCATDQRVTETCREDCLCASKFGFGRPAYLPPLLSP
jgi:hypothetical protein